jgi:hypothetical protein
MVTLILFLSNTIYKYYIYSTKDPLKYFLILRLKRNVPSLYNFKILSFLTDFLIFVKYVAILKKFHCSMQD